MTTFLALLVGVVAGGGGAVMVRVVRAERTAQRTQVKAWEQEWAEQAADAAVTQAVPATSGPRPGEAATFRMPAQPVRPVVVTSVVVDQAPECAR